MLESVIVGLVTVKVPVPAGSKLPLASSVVTANATVPSTISGLPFMLMCPSIHSTKNVIFLTAPAASRVFALIL
jgi:hypothetical protein